MGRGPRGSVGRAGQGGVPHLPTHARMAMADTGRHPRGSGSRTSPAGVAGAALTPQPPLPLRGERGETDLGGNQVPPASPGLPRRGGFPTETSPCQPWRWEKGENMIWGRAWPSPNPRVAAARALLPNGCLPVSDGDGRRDHGSGGPSPAPSPWLPRRGGVPRETASRQPWRRERGSNGFGGNQVPPPPGLPRRRGFHKAAACRGPRHERRDGARSPNPQSPIPNPRPRLTDGHGSRTLRPPAGGAPAVIGARRA